MQPTNNALLPEEHKFTPERLNRVFLSDITRTPERTTFYGKAISLLKDMGRLLLGLVRKIEALWETGKWITLHSSVQNLNDRIQLLDKAVNLTPISAENCRRLAKTIAEMNKTKQILFDAGSSQRGYQLDTDKLDGINNQLFEWGIVNSPLNDLQRYLPLLNSKTLNKLSDEQVKNLDLTCLNQAQISHVLIRDNTYRVDILSTRQLQKILPKLSKDCLRNISIEQLKTLDLSQLSNDQFSSIALIGTRWEERMKALSDSQFQSILPKLPINDINKYEELLIRRPELDLTTH